MFGAYIRAAVTIGIAVLSGALLNFFIPYLLPYQGPEDGLLYQLFATLGNNAVFLMLLAVAAGVLAAALRESETGVR